MTTKKKGKTTAGEITIAAPNFQTGEFILVGTAPYVQNKFSAKALNEMREKQEAGSTAKKGKKREAKDFEQCYESAKHVADDGWLGIPAPAFRNGMIDACRAAGFHMTKAKMSVFVEADGFDKQDGTPLVRITKGEPKTYDPDTCIDLVRNATGVVDLRPRPRWAPGWEAKVRVRFDADQFTLTDVANLLMRVGMQVGIGEGRPFSKNSNGMGWGLFDLKNGKK